MRTMEGGRWPVACRICVYAPAAPPYGGSARPTCETCIPERVSARRNSVECSGGLRLQDLMQRCGQNDARG